MSTNPILQEIKDADSAYMSAITPKILNGKQLEPYSTMRRAIALEIVGKQSIVFTDALVKVWLCTLTPRQAVSARLDREQAMIDAYEWADKWGYTITGCKPLLDVYHLLEAEVEATMKVLNENAPDPDEEDQEGPKVSGELPGS